MYPCHFSEFFRISFNLRFFKINKNTHISNQNIHLQSKHIFSIKVLSWKILWLKFKYLKFISHMEDIVVLFVYLTLTLKRVKREGCKVPPQHIYNIFEKID
jgi:hypothetical protein